MINEIIINIFTPTIILATLVDSFTPLIKSIVNIKTIVIAGRFTEKGICPNKYGTLSCISQLYLSHNALIAL